MKAICVVAHPDDCVIFAFSFIHHHRHLDWSMVYLTYTEQDDRASEMIDFWRQQNIACEFLGHTDDYRDIEHNRISFDTNRARDQIHKACNSADIILTHNSQGDYGHIHHRFVNRCVSLIMHPHVITFAPPNQGTHHYCIPDGIYDLDRLPLHKDIVKSFHADRHCNDYVMSDATKSRIESCLNT